MATRVKANGTRVSSTGSALSRSRRSNSSSSSGSTAPKKKIDYTFNSQKESAAQYNARIAAERGDSAASLKSMQRTTANTFKSRGMDAGKVGGGVITSTDLAPTEKIKLPPPAVTEVPDITANNVGFNDPATGVSAGPNGMLTVTPPADDKYAGVTKIQSDFEAALSRLNNEAPSAADIQRQLEKETGLRRKQQAVNDLTAQLNTIVANRDANKLKLEGQGRGITDTIIGGQQAQIDREAAIAALPVQAQLAAAQGNLALAQDHIATWGNILMRDAENRYNRKKEVLTSVRDFAVGIEFKRIDDLNAKNEREYQEARELAKAKTSALSAALGQGAPSSVMSAIKSATTLEDVVAAAGIYNGDVLGQAIKREQLNNLRNPAPTGTGGSVVVNGVALKEVTDAEIKDLNTTAIKTDSAVKIIDNMIQSIRDNGSYIMWGTEKGKRESNRTSLLLAMKALEGTGALDQGTIDVLSGTIPNNEKFANDAGQIGKLQNLRATLTEKSDAFISSYRGTTAQIDPRTARIFESTSAGTTLSPEEDALLDSFLKTGSSSSQSTSAFNPAAFF